ncbi:MAG: hypothetical protein IT378_04340 [Sandaracinaceae bacterium]|nr:hypothetical protein [Sandaracinaceae bacterium]
MEHDAELRTQVVAALTSAGFLAVGLGDARRALADVARQPPQVLVAEMDLPGMAGDTLIENARKVAGATLRVTVLIGGSLPDVLLPDSDAIDARFGAPIDVQALVERVLAPRAVGRTG